MNILNFIGGCLMALGVLLYLRHLEKYQARKNPPSPWVIKMRVPSAGYIITLEKNTMNKFNLSLTPFVILAVAGLSHAESATAVDGAITALSSDNNVLTVTPTGEGLFRVDFVGPGKADVTFSADADLSDEVRTITHTVSYELFDSSSEADHLSVTVVEVGKRIPAAESLATGDAGEQSGQAAA